MIYVIIFAVGCAIGIRAFIKHRAAFEELFSQKDMTEKQRAQYLDWCAQSLVEKEQQAETDGDL